VVALCAAPVRAASTDTGDNRIVLRAWGVPTGSGASPDALATLETLAAFQQKFPHVKPISSAGLMIPGRTMDITPLMQIAGDIAADVMYVNFRQSDTYIRSKFLYPLDRYMERMVGADIPDSHLLSNEAYLAQISKAPDYATYLEWRVPGPMWKVMRRRCPYEDECAVVEKWNATPRKEHMHVWAFPEGPLVMAMIYRRDLFAEAGLPDRVPETIEEMLAFGRRLHHPEKNQYGMLVSLNELSWSTLSFLYSYGGLIVDQDEEGKWHCVFDSDEAVDAYSMVARFFLEPYENEHGSYNRVIYPGQAQAIGEIHYGMQFAYIDQRFFTQTETERIGFGPVPLGPTGQRGSEFNSRMAGIYAGLIDDDARRDAAWEYIRFYDGLEARKIRARIFVERGFGRFLMPDVLRRTGYEELIDQSPPGWAEAYEIAAANGVPEPYGRNCQQVYTYASKGINQLINDADVKSAIQSGDTAAAKDRIRDILRERVRISNEKMLQIFTPKQERTRSWRAIGVTTAIIIIFVFSFRYVFRVFSQQAKESLIVSDSGDGKKRGHWQFDRFGVAYALMIPALASIALWNYYPLIRGTVIAFQDYNVRGFTEWIGMKNFADVIHDKEFWYAVWISVKYSLMYVFFGFGTPIMLAFLLTEVPRGKILFRMIYYLPAVLTGVIVIFLWKGFYGQYGMINQVLNFGVAALNFLPGVQIDPLAVDWLNNPNLALFFCLLPSIWAGMGPGCLIYLAALKTVPDELYEAADVDGAGTRHKLFKIALPSIKGLILINFVGVMIGVIRSGSEFMLAMTGGGPYTPFGQTEVVGLHIYWQAFGFLRFGAAAAMGWILGSLLIGFTLWQVQRLSKMEFRSAASSAAE
jgi:multiple sugar transport system permease protein